MSLLQNSARSLRRIENELIEANDSLNLLPLKILQVLSNGSNGAPVMTNKYASKVYPGKRYYSGCEVC